VIETTGLEANLARTRETDHSRGFRPSPHRVADSFRCGTFPWRAFVGTAM